MKKKNRYFKQKTLGGDKIELHISILRMLN
jgi:hypothetical protein